MTTTTVRRAGVGRIESAGRDSKPQTVVPQSTESRIQQYLDDAGIARPAREFCREVSNVYHGFEATRYNGQHEEITETAERWRRCLTIVAPTLPNRIRLLDVGTGTGWACEQVLRALGSRVDDVVCLDLSPDMIAQCEQRIRPLASRARFVVGEVSDLRDAGEQFDLVVTSSVLHHVIDLDLYLTVLGQVIRPGGMYIAGGEPSAGFYANRELFRWTTAYRIWRRSIRRAQRLLSPKPAHVAASKSIDDLTNEELLRSGVIPTLFPRGVIPRFVDIHVPPGDAGVPFWGEPGLSADAIRQRLGAEFETVFVTTYPHLKDARSRMGPIWRAIDDRLAKRFPESGALLLTAVVKAR